MTATERAAALKAITETKDAKYTEDEIELFEPRGPSDETRLLDVPESRGLRGRKLAATNPRDRGRTRHDGQRFLRLGIPLTTRLTAAHPLGMIVAAFGAAIHRPRLRSHNRRPVARYSCRTG